MSTKPEFSHETRCYTFLGREIDQAKIGPHDPSWVPPKRQVFCVEIQNDGLWQIKHGGVKVASGDRAKCSRSNALALLNENCRVLLSF